MLRDPRKDEAYFEAYIEYQKKRINMFAQQLELLEENVDANRQKIALCSRYLTNFTADLFSAEYSYGCDIETLKATFDQHVSYFQKNDTITISDTLFTFSVAIMFDMDCAGIINQSKVPDDAVSIELFRRGTKSIVSEDSLSESISDFMPAKFLMDSLQGNVTLAELKDYIENRWYDDNGDAVWYDSHKSDSDTYCGYWCYIGAAIVKILGFDFTAFRGTAYFPYDLFTK